MSGPAASAGPLSREFLRYGGGSLAMLGIKILLMQLWLLALDEVPAYAVVQVFVFLISYLLHSRLTFGTRLGWRSLGRYLQTMVAFLFLDWFLFTILFHRLSIDSTVIILLCTGLVFVLRFLFVRRSLRGFPA